MDSMPCAFCAKNSLYTWNFFPTRVWPSFPLMVMFAGLMHLVDPVPGIANEYTIINQIAPAIPVTALNQMMQQMVTTVVVVAMVVVAEIMAMAVAETDIDLYLYKI